VRLLYEIDPPIPGFLFSAFYFAISAVTTLSLSAVLDRRGAGETVAPAESSQDEHNDRVAAGLELGTWLFLGNTLQLLGLKTVAADRAGFLVQRTFPSFLGGDGTTDAKKEDALSRLVYGSVLYIAPTVTTVLVPLMSALIAGNLLAVDVRTWIACLVALAGIVVMNVDLANLTTTTASLGISSGDALILASALMYTMHVIRLGRWAPCVPPLKLAASKSTVETILSVVLVSVSIAAASVAGSDAPPNFVVNFLQESGRELIGFFQTVADRAAAGTLSSDSVGKAIGATLWAGWVVTA
jgi:hypothetical protein